MQTFTTRTCGLELVGGNKESTKVQAHGGAVRALEPLPQQGGLVASGGDDGTIRSWSFGC